MIDQNTHTTNFITINDIHIRSEVEESGNEILKFYFNGVRFTIPSIKYLHKKDRIRLRKFINSILKE